MAKEFRIVLKYDAPKMPAGGGLPGMPSPAGTNALTGALRKLAPAIGGVVLAQKGFSALMSHSEEMAQVGIMANKTGDELKELGHDILDLSAKYGKASSDMRKAAYNVYSAQVPATEAMNVLEQSTRAAIAGNAEVSDSFNLMSSIIKGYGKDWSEIGDVSDHVFKIIELGQTTMPELAGSMGKVVPIAKAMGVELDELSGFYATFTGVTGNADEVSTQLRATMTAFMSPTVAMQEHVKALGYASAEALVKEEGLANALNIVAAATDGSAEAMAELFPQIRAMPLVMAATSSQSDVLADKIAKLGERAGATDAAVEKVELSTAQRMEKMKATLEATLVKLFETLEPVINLVVDTVTELFTVLQPITKILSPIAKILGEILAPVLQLIGELIDTLVWLLEPVGKALEFVAGGADDAGKSVDDLTKILKMSLGPLGWFIDKLQKAKKVSDEATEAQKNLAKALKNSSDKLKAGEKVRTFRQAVADIEETGKVTNDTIKDFEVLRDAGIISSEELQQIKDLKDNLGIMRNNLRGAIREQEKAIDVSKAQADIQRGQAETLEYLTEQLKAYGIEFKGVGEITEQIEQATAELEKAQEKRAEANIALSEEEQRKMKEFQQAEAAAADEIVRLDYESGRISFEQYVAHLQAKMNAIEGANQQEILARMELQNEIDALNLQAIEKDLALQDMLLNEQIELAERARDRILANEEATTDEKIASGARYFELREQQILEQAAAEEWSAEETDIYLRKLARERLDWEKELRDEDAQNFEENEERKRQATENAFRQMQSNIASTMSAITDIYDSQMQKQIDAVKARGLTEYEEQQRIAEITEDFAKKKERIAKIEKSVKVSQAISNTALAVTRALADPGGILGVILAGVVAAAGAAQTAAIIAQPYYKGGIIRKGQVGFIEGYRDEAVNIPMRGEGSFQEVAKLELIPEILNDLRSSRGGRLSGVNNVSGDRIIHTEIKEIYNGAVLTSDVAGVNEWKRRGAAYYSDRILKEERALEGKR